MPTAPKTASARRARARRHTLVATLIAAGLVVAAGATAAVLAFALPHDPTPAGKGTTFLVSADTAAAQQAAAQPAGTAEHDAASYLAAQPTAVWLTPERDPIGAVGDRIRALADEARAQDATLALVVYGLPERDCGNHSAGGLNDADYDTWTSEIAAALAAADDLRRIVVLEPDSIALADECGNLEARALQLREVVAKLQLPGVWVYLDGGHSSWHSVTDMAAYLQYVGLEGVRGVALNVSNYNSTVDEALYAYDLDAAVGGGLHAIIDTSRNGAGSDGQWCNPPGRLIGEPAGSIGDDVVDTNLWIKVPGESDGTCNGGPAAGQWWPASAIELTREAVR
ncbi:glycoside hydrolase family 6 protein [Microbacterium sp. W1N]|uniref:glycoside hydrolase family 6 protein n=1 Tax=Microbacterium festucae TaxID=2977531 RepID=UPI0021C1E020|nr:glycoside hydrolase family 6 protein [Microbacterium festucae]MCT9819051.1 glycoside hydrolase family 6 protein [Microbacterium festucae]